MSHRSILVPIAADHAGYDLKSFLLENFNNNQWELKDLGTFSQESVDYPDYTNQLVSWMKDQLSPFGILICGSGQGMAMRANKFSEIRAALCWNEEITRLSRQHNDANIICMGSRFLKPQEAMQMVEVFLKTPFEGGRHQRRVDKLSSPC